MEWSTLAFPLQDILSVCTQNPGGVFEWGAAFQWYPTLVPIQCSGLFKLSSLSAEAILSSWESIFLFKISPISSSFLLRLSHCSLLFEQHPNTQIHAHHPPAPPPVHGCFFENSYTLLGFVWRSLGIQTQYYRQKVLLSSFQV